MDQYDLENHDPSLPSRERGLKSESYNGYTLPDDVAPLAGAWIEMIEKIEKAIAWMVAPLAGAWIEIAEAEW